MRLRGVAIATSALALLLAATFAVHGALMVLAVPVMRAGAEHVGLTVRQFRYIGVLELAAAAGLVAGLVVPALGAAAGAGVIVLMAAAAAAHIRVGDPPARMVPAVALGAAALLYEVLLAVGG